MIAAAAVLLALPYLASAADHRHSHHQRPHRRPGDAAMGATGAVARRDTQGTPATGASDQPLDVYPDPRAQQSDDMVATSRDARAQGLHAARGGTHNARMYRSGNCIYVSDDVQEDDDSASASGANASDDDDDADAKADDQDVYTLPFHVLGCCISAVDVPHEAFMHPPVDGTDNTSLSACTPTAHSRHKRRRAQQVVTHHQAVSLAITVWRLVRDDTGTYYVKEDVIAVHVGLHLRGTFLLAPLTSSRGQILCMVMATHYARLFRRLRHAIVLTRYTSHHVAIRNGTGATDVHDIAPGVRWLAEQFHGDPHHIGSNHSDCVGRLADRTLVAAAILDATANHIKGISNASARGTEHLELVVTALEACAYFGDPRIEAALRDWRTTQPDDRPPSPGAGAAATASPTATAPMPRQLEHQATDDSDDPSGAGPMGAGAAAATPRTAPNPDHTSASAAGSGSDPPVEPELHRGTPRRQGAAAHASMAEPTPPSLSSAAADVAAPDDAPHTGEADDGSGGDTEAEDL